MQFECVHDLPFALPLVEEALRSQTLAAEVKARVPGLARLEARDEAPAHGELRRVWLYQSRGIPLIGSLGMPDEWLQWEEHLRYRLSDHLGRWHFYPRPGAPADGPWRSRFRAEGTYRLEEPAEGATRRTVAGCFDLRLPVASALMERAAVSELRKVYAAEADVLGMLCRQH